VSTPLAGFVAEAGLLDLENRGAVVCEDLGAERAGEDAGEVEDADAVEWEGVRWVLGV
jgi:hypothetical protein